MTKTDFTPFLIRGSNICAQNLEYRVIHRVQVQQVTEGQEQGIRVLPRPEFLEDDLRPGKLLDDAVERALLALTQQVVKVASL